MSQTSIMNIELQCFSYILLFLCPAHAAHKDSPGLHCTNDFVSNVSCTWVSYRDAPAEDCCIFGVKLLRNFNSIKQSCKLKQHAKSPPGCSFAFKGTVFSGSEVMPIISVQCNGTLVENLTDYMPAHHIKLHPPEAPNVTVTSNDTWISWSLGNPVSYLLKSRFIFEVQITKNNHYWGDAMNLSTEQQQHLTLSTSELKGYRRVRVRAKPANRKGSQWSNWSPATSWMGPTDRLDMMNNQDWWQEQSPLGLLLPVCLIIILLLLYKSCRTRRFFKVKPVPNPSSYFHSLYSIHGGNLKKWLNPASVPESFATPQSSDLISTVEVCEDWKRAPMASPSSGPTSCLVHLHDYPSTDFNNSVYDSSSTYSNLGYFMSSSSGSSARSDPTYYTYQDDFHSLPHSHHHALCAPLTSHPSYESLKRVPESPDSGLGITMEKKMEVTRYMDTECENVPLSPVLILPLHFPSHVCPPSSPPLPPPHHHPSTFTQTLSDSQQVIVHEEAASSPPWLVSGAMCRSSSMPVEPSRSGYLTLKELHTTFSNKSI